MSHKEFEDRSLLLVVYYEGPWAKLSNWCYGIRKDGELLWEIPQDARGLKWLLSKAGNWAELKDRAWRGKHVLRRTDPHKFWKYKR